MTVYTGNPPLTQNSRDGSTYLNLREFFPELSPSAREKNGKVEDGTLLCRKGCPLVP